MRAGMLRYVVTIQQKTVTPDSQGGQAVTWATRAVTRGHLEPMHGSENLLASQQTAVLTDIVTLRYRSDVSVMDRVVIDTRTLQVQSVQDPTGLRRETRLLCSEVQG